MIAFREGYEGQVWLEILLLDWSTGTLAEVERLAALAARIAPDRIQLNTVARPPAESFAEPVAGRPAAGVRRVLHAARGGDRAHRDRLPDRESWRAPTS